MRTSKLLLVLLGCLLTLATSQMVAAEEKPVPSAEPPKLEKLDDSQTPTVNIAPPASERSVTEKRRQGRVEEVKVKSGKSTYYLKPNRPAGSAIVGDVQSDTVRPAQWKIKEFDLGNKKKVEAKDAADAPQPPEVTPTLAPKK